MSIYRQNLFLLLVVLCGGYGCEAQPAGTGALPFRLEIKCNNDYCDVSPIGPDLYEGKTTSASVDPNRVNKNILQYQDITGTNKGATLFCLFGNAEKQDLYIVGITDGKAAATQKATFYNISPWSLSTDGDQRAVYAQLRPVNWKAASRINNAFISKSLLKETTFLVLNADSLNVADTLSTSLCSNALFRLNGPLFSTAAFNDRWQKCILDTMGHAYRDPDTARVLSIKDKQVGMGEGGLITYDIDKKELLTIPLNTHDLKSYQVVARSDSALFISATYNDQIKAMDNKRFVAMRKELVYYDKKTRQLKTLFTTKCLPAKYTIVKHNTNHSGMVFSNELIQQNEDYIVYSILGVDTAIGAKNTTSKIYKKDASGNVNDTLYQSIGYNAYLTINVVVSNKTLKEVCTRYDKGFTVLKNGPQGACSSGSVWELDKNTGPEFISRIIYENEQLIMVINDPYQNGYPENYTYRIYKKQAL